MLYNVVLISAIPQHESALSILMSLPLESPSHPSLHPSPLLDLYLSELSVLPGVPTSGAYLARLLQAMPSSLQGEVAKRIFSLLCRTQGEDWSLVPPFPTWYPCLRVSQVAQRQRIHLQCIGLISGLGRSPGEGNGNLLRYS